MNEARSLPPKSRSWITRAAPLALALLLAACATPPPAPPPESPVLLEARAAADRGDWSSAGAAWERVATTEPNARYAWLDAAEAWWKAGNAARSRDALDRLQPGDLIERSDFGLRATEKWIKAVEIYSINKY